jgi:hypothetical protein
MMIIKFTVEWYDLSTISVTDISGKQKHFGVWYIKTINGNSVLGRYFVAGETFHAKTFAASMSDALLISLNYADGGHPYSSN